MFRLGCSIASAAFQLVFHGLSILIRMAIRLMGFHYSLYNYIVGADHHSTSDTEHNRKINEMNNDLSYQIKMEGYVRLVTSNEYREELKDERYVITAKCFRKIMTGDNKGWARKAMVRYAVLAISRDSDSPPILCVYAEKSLQFRPEKPDCCFNLRQFESIEKPARFNRRYPVLFRNGDDTYHMFAANGYEAERWWANLMKFSGSTLTENDHEYWTQYVTRLRAENAPAAKKYDTLKRIGSHFSRTPASIELNYSWLNVMIGRFWMMIKDRKELTNHFAEKIIKKISSAKKSSFMGETRLKQLDFGDWPPIFREWKTIDTEYENIEISASMEYEGNAAIHLETDLSLDRHKSSMKISLAVEIVCERISGTIIFKFNPPPCNTIWWCFETSPQLKLRISPVVADADVGFNMVKDIVESRIKSIIDDSIVWPNMEGVALFNN